MLLNFLHHLLQALFEVTTITGACQQRAHVQRENRRFRQNFRHFAFIYFARQSFSNRGLAHTRITNVKRVVLRAATQNLNRAVNLRGTANQRVDFAVLGLFIEVDAIGFQRGLFFLGFTRLCFALLAVLRLIAISARSLWLRKARPLGNAMRNIVHRVKAGHILLLQEVSRMAFAFGKYRNQHIGSGHIFTAGTLDMDDRALDHALKSCGWLCIRFAIHNQVGQFVVDIIDKALAQLVEINRAGAHNRDCILIFKQRQQQVLEGCKFVMTLIGRGQCAVQRLFERAGKTWHLQSFTFFP